jgi:phage baseplate assembly protein W
MANLGDKSATANAINTLATPISIVSKKKGWSDLNLSLVLHHIRKDIMPLRDDAAIKNAVRNLILTNFYERPFQPEKAAGLRGLLFEPADTITKLELRDAIWNVLEDYEPRIWVRAVDIVDNSDRNHWDITITFKIKEFDTNTEVEIILQRLR